MPTSLDLIKQSNQINLLSILSPFEGTILLELTGLIFFAEPLDFRCVWKKDIDTDLSSWLDIPKSGAVCFVIFVHGWPSEQSLMPINNPNAASNMFSE